MRRSRNMEFLVARSKAWGDDCFALPTPQTNLLYGSKSRRVGWVACYMANGAPPDGAVAINKCGASDCVNGTHWRWGTWDEVMAAREFPSRRGGRNPNAKLTEADVAAIRAIDFGVRNNRRPVAERYNISLPTLHAIIKGWTWKGVEAATGEPETAAVEEGDEF